LGYREQNKQIQRHATTQEDIMRTVARVLILSFILTGIAFAGPGKIKGKVVDKESKEGLVGANVSLVGTSYGATTDVNGDYQILNVPAGEYTLKATYVGYAAFNVTGFRVNSDFTTEQNFAMSSEAVTMQQVEVVAVRPLIRKDYTNTTTVKTADDIANLPIRGVSEVVGLQASVVKNEGSNLLYVRGGRPEEVSYLMDGVPVNNPLSGRGSAAFTNVNQNIVEELQVQTGGFNAEYGSALSGIINLNTKSATNKYTATAEFVTDALGNPTTGKDGVWGYYLGNVSIGGPVIPDNDIATLFLSGEHQILTDNDPRAVGGIKPNTKSTNWGFSGKLALKPTKEMDLKLGGNYFGSKGNNWNNLDRFLNWEHHQKFDNATLSGFARFTHNIGANLFYSLQGSYFNEKLKSGDGVWYDDLLSYGDPAKNPALPSTAQNPGARYSFLSEPGTVIDRFTKSQSEIFTYNADVTIQAGAHLLKAGGEYRTHKIRRYTINPMGLALNLQGSGADGDWERYRNQNVEYYGFNYTGDTEYDGEDDFFRNDTNDKKEGPKKPIYLAFYLQDKFELADLVLNFGLRVDHFDAKEMVPKDPLNPFGARLNPDGSINPSGGVFDANDWEASSATTQVSPRLGFSFPITDRAVFHAQYGTFLQMPPLQYVLISKTWADRYMGDSPFSTRIPNPNLKPERTVAYELGFRQLLTDNVAFSVTGFYKEVKDLIQARNFGVGSTPAFPNSYESYENVDFGTVKGFDVIFEMRRTSNIAMQVNYTLSFANGTGSEPQRQGRITWIQSQAPKLVAPLDYDRRHAGSVNIDYRLGEGMGPKFGDLYLLERTGLNLLFTFNSGVPYTRSIVTNPFFGGVTEIRPTGAINEASTPWNFRFDLNVNRTFKVGPVDLVAFLSVINVLDADNVVSVYVARRGGAALENETGIYRGTGLPDNSGWLATRDGQIWAQTNGPEAVRLFKEREANPENFGMPRQVRVGLRLEY
jgi:outer membrane receptor for ferrienterochelin and colicin